MNQYQLWVPILIGLFLFLGLVLMMARGRRQLSHISFVMFLVTLIGGLVLYTISYLPQNPSGIQSVRSLFRGVFSTGRMFLGNDDYSYLLGREDMQWLVENNWFQIIFWFFHVTALFVSVSALLSAFGQKLLDQLKLHLMFYKSTYVIFGTSPQALLMGENIAYHDKTRSSPDRKRLIVFLCETVDAAVAEAAERFGGVTLSYDKERLEPTLRRAGLSKPTRRTGEISFFLLGEREQDAVQICADLCGVAERYKVEPQNLSLYVLAESEWVKEALEKRKVHYNSSVFSKAELAARKLILELPPFACIKTEDGVAKENVTALVIGFGQLGQQVLRHLIMNGQFVGGSMKPVIIDREMDSRLGRFSARYPGLVSDYGIESYQLDVKSLAFYELLQKLADTDLRYIVVALGDESLNLDTAGDVRRFLIQNGKSCGNENAEIRIAAAAPNWSKENGIDDGVITCFARDNSLFGEAVLIRREIDQMAQAVMSVYYKCESRDQAKKLWHQVGNFERDSNRAVADFLPAMLALAGYQKGTIPSPEEFRLSPSLTETLARTEHLRWNAFHYAMGYLPMSYKQMLAYLQELKQKGQSIELCRSNPVSRRHICLVPWEQLDRISEDYNAVLRAEGMQSDRDFIQNDIDNVQNLPKFIQAYQDAREKKRRENS